MPEKSLAFCVIVSHAKRDQLRDYRRCLLCPVCCLNRLVYKKTDGTANFAPSRNAAHAAQNHAAFSLKYAAFSGKYGVLFGKCGILFKTFGTIQKVVTGCPALISDKKDFITACSKVITEKKIVVTSCSIRTECLPAEDWRTTRIITVLNIQ